MLQTLASNDEAALTDKKSNIGQCARGAAGATTPLAMTLALVGAMVLATGVSPYSTTSPLHMYSHPRLPLTVCGNL